MNNSYSRFNRRRHRTQSRHYAILINGVFADRALGKTNRSVLINYCRAQNIPYTDGSSIGLCGMVHSQCIINYSGARYCGSRGKCAPIYVIQTAVGPMTAVQL